MAVQWPANFSTTSEPLTKKELIRLLDPFPDSAEVVVPSPEEPGGVSGARITHVVKLKNGKAKLSIYEDKDRERGTWE